MTRVAIGLDVGGTRIRAARVDETGRILDKRIIEGTRDPRQALARFETLIAELDTPDVAAIGIGVPGRVDTRTGDVLSGGFLNLAGIDVRSALAERFSRPVAISNDCSMALIGEARAGAGLGLANIVMLTIGTGIGGAAMLDGRIVTGSQAAGQLGHLVVKHDGLACVCGQRGCVEMYSSGTSFARLVGEFGLKSGYRCEEALADAVQDATARHLIEAWAAPLRAAISTLSAAFDPDVLLLGGGLGGRALAALDFVADAGHWYRTPVAAAALGDDAGVIGAALAGLDLVPAATHAGKRLVMVNGVPASGKSHVAAAVSRETGWPVLALDTIKNPFLAEIGAVDRPFNRLLGRATYAAIWDTIAAAPEGSAFIVDAWFGFQPIDVLTDGITRAGITSVVEVWCTAPPEIIGERYRARVGTRPKGHPGEEYVPELIALAARARPFTIGPVIDVDTTRPVAVEPLARDIVTYLDRNPTPFMTRDEGGPPPAPARQHMG